jgi:hypothetical protein
LAEPIFMSKLTRPLSRKKWPINLSDFCNFPTTFHS